MNEASMRTTSSLESMNSALRRLTTAHPSTFRFVDCIRMHEFSKSVELADEMKHGRIIAKNRSRAEELDEKIKHLTLALDENSEMNAGMFLEKLTIGKFHSMIDL